MPCIILSLVFWGSDISRGKGEGHIVHAGVCNVCGSTHSCGCVVNGSVLLGQHFES